MGVISISRWPAGTGGIAVTGRSRRSPLRRCASSARAASMRWRDASFALAEDVAEGGGIAGGCGNAAALGGAAGWGLGAVWAAPDLGVAAGAGLGSVGKVSSSGGAGGGLEGGSPQGEEDVVHGGAGRALQAE